ncbi:hypothetical protein BBJ28_00007328 [Nothophytophthora sp. Chile5]|nr:hypothetical protein BBJ28_00007328 [Nothophytophthora sp. Chile5]
MENWRRVDDVQQKRLMLVLSAFALGGCGIWCTHFTGMTALNLELKDGTTLEVDFELGFTILSFVFAVLGVFIIALLSRLWLIMAGGAFAALGVLGMHYMGMMAQRTNAAMSFDVGIVVVSLTFMPNSELLRLGSALIMGVAVCATHYCGMGAASYAPSPENFTDNTRFILNGPGASVVASHAALLTPIEGEEILQHWQASKIVLSYLIAVTGTIQLMEKWRSAQNPKDKLVLLVLSSVALGGCGIWCMHFTGMTALQLTREDGSILPVDFEAGLTVLSFICAVLGVFVGLKIASTDPFFLEMEQEKRKSILDLAHVGMSDLVNKQKVAKRIRLAALFSRLPRIAGGGLFAAFGVLVMHYLGMMAQRTEATMHLTAGLVVLSTIIAFVTATAAFWIIFRAVRQSLGSALIMGIAVCGTHYSGMGAASYTYASHPATSGEVVMKGAQAAVLASHGALLFCYWVMTWSVASSVRNIVAMNSTMSKRSTRDRVTPGAQRIMVASQARAGGSVGNASESTIEQV